VSELSLCFLIEAAGIIFHRQTTQHLNANNDIH